MNNILNIAKKELSRVFKDRRMLIMLFLPGLIIYIIYSLLGNALADKSTNEAKAVLTQAYTVYEINMPSQMKDDITAVYTNFNPNNDALAAGYIQISGTLTDEGKAALLKNGDADLILVFDTDFETLIGSGVLPNVSVYYNPNKATSNTAYGIILNEITAYRQEQVNAIFGDTQLFTDSSQQITDSSAISPYIAMVFPMLLIALLFSGCMGVTPESIAGEKERGTMATLLATPVKRSEIAIGKILALSALASISAISSFIGIIFSLPKIIGGSVSSIFAVYGAGNIILLLLTLISTVLLIVGLLSVISSFSRSVKEATMFITPFMLISIVLGVLNMVIGVPTGFFYYLIPVYNTIASIAAILNQSVSIINLAVTIISNIVYVSILVLVMAKIFNNEKIMFAK